MNYNEEFEDVMSDVNDTAKGYGYTNGIKWAEAAQMAGDISYSDYKDYENCHNLRVRFSHGSARDISISSSTLGKAYNFLRDIRNSNLRKRKNTPNLPDGTFRAPYVKEFHWDGYEGRRYDFKFHIVKEYQKRSYDDGTRFEGHGFTIYVKEAPYKDWCLEHNTEHEFHFYASPYDNPSICWNTLITDFEQANAVMFVWVKRYSIILDRLFQDKSINEYSLRRSSDRKGILPTGTFRI